LAENGPKSLVKSGCRGAGAVQRGPRTGLDGTLLGRGRWAFQGTGELWMVAKSDVPPKGWLKPYQ